MLARVAGRRELGRVEARRAVVAWEAAPAQMAADQMAAWAPHGEKRFPCRAALLIRGFSPKMGDSPKMGEGLGKTA